MAARLALCLGLLALLAPGIIPAQAADKLTQSQADTRLVQLKTEIRALQQEIGRKRNALTAEQKAIKTIDLKIQNSAMALRKLEVSRLTHTSDLAQLQTERDNYLRSIEERRQALASQILTAYRLGRESRLKLVFNQDSPARLERTLAYYDYFNRTQAVRISELKEVLQTLDQMQQKINVELSALDEVQTNQQVLMDDMTTQRNQRQLIANNLSAGIDTQEQQLTELEANRKDLQSLLEKLTDALSDIPANMDGSKGPAELKGRLPIPVKGRVKHAFGQTRTAGLSWQGWLIAASNGAEVKTIAHGRVAFSDWLRGYGLLMIIDHGDGFMSLYGNNESLLYEVGDWVGSGASISTVGTSPVNGDSLYFEIRRDGKAVDPAVWIKR